ncbi:MAG: hypothetical protein N3D14_00570 [Aquificaceae bacterium]|nr:hypothetical protein [Aquificaceae bacterium]
MSSGRVLDMKATGNRTSVCNRATGELHGEGRNVKEVLANTSYDTYKIFRHLAGGGIKPVIKVRIKAVITGNRARDEVVMAIREN